MSRKRAAPIPEESWLFDLPLEPADPSPAEGAEGEEPVAAMGDDGSPEPSTEAGLEPEALALFPESADEEEPAATAPEERDPAEPAGLHGSDFEPQAEAAPYEGAVDAAEEGREMETPDRPAAPQQPGPLVRAQAGLVDLGTLIGVLLTVLVGATLMGVDVLAGPPIALGLFLTVFSFLYYTLPLAFWGRTPGMAAAGLVARSEAGGPLTFAQTFLRWLGAVVTVLAAGLPLLLALAGASLSDRLSGSRTGFRG